MSKLGHNNVPDIITQVLKTWAMQCQGSTMHRWNLLSPHSRRFHSGAQQSLGKREVPYTLYGHKYQLLSSHFIKENSKALGEISSIFLIRWIVCRGVQGPGEPALSLYFRRICKVMPRYLKRQRVPSVFIAVQLPPQVALCYDYTYCLRGC